MRPVKIIGGLYHFLAFVKGNSEMFFAFWVRNGKF